MEAPVSDLLPNRFRDIEHYPVQEDKIEALIQSYKSTGYWGNILGRKTKDGKVETACAFHRGIALQRTHKPTDKVPVIIQDLSDVDMLRIMIDENQEVWGHDFLVELESVQAVINAAKAGIIQLPELGGKGKNSPANLLKSPLSIARFLNWVSSSGLASIRVQSAVKAIRLIEEGILKREDLKGLGNEQARYVVNEAAQASKEHPESERFYREQAEQIETETERVREQLKKTDKLTPFEKAQAQARLDELEQKSRYSKQQEKKHREAPKKIVNHVSEGLRTGKFGKRQVKEQVAKILDNSNVKAPPPEVAKFISDLTHEVFNFLSPVSERTARLDAIVRSKDEIDSIKLEGLIDNLEHLAESCLAYAKKLGRRSVKRVGHTVHALPAK